MKRILMSFPSKPVCVRKMGLEVAVCWGKGLLLITTSASVAASLRPALLPELVADSCSHRSERSLGLRAPWDILHCAEHFLAQGNVSMNQDIHLIHGSRSKAFLCNSLMRRGARQGPGVSEVVPRSMRISSATSPEIHLLPVFMAT